MPLDPEFVAETRAWLLKAAYDLRAGEVLGGTDVGLAGNALYHCQQAAEKTLKAFLAWHGRIFRKTHNIEELGQQVIEITPAFASLIRESSTLTDYAWRFRYPGDEQEPAPEELPQALILARRLYEAVIAELPPEVRP